MFETGLGVARSLGIHGIQVYGLDFKKDIGFYSKYTKASICPNPDNEEEFINFIYEFALNFKLKPILYITSDNFLLSISRNIEKLEKKYLINIPSCKLLYNIIDKYNQYKIARKKSINIPRTIKFLAKSNPNKILNENFDYPVLIKGLDSITWRAAFGGTKKGIIVNNKKELVTNLLHVKKIQTDVLIQEIITGPETNHFKFCAYVDKNNKLKYFFTLRKIRQNPIHFGVGCIVESIKYPKLVKEGKKLFSRINYSGIGSAEFKLDKKDNKLKLIELNPRYWQQNYLSTVCGINFPLIQYLDLTNQSFIINSDYEENVKWINIYLDFESFLNYKKNKEITLIKWLKSFKGKKIFSDFAIDDLIPGFFEVRFGKRLIKIPNLFKKIYE